MFLGHNNGTVSLRTPNMTSAVASMFVGPGPIQSLAVDHGGKCVRRLCVSACFRQPTAVQLHGGESDRRPRAHL